MATPYTDAVLADNPLLYWKFNEIGAAATAADTSGNGRTGTYTGSPTLGDPSQVENGLAMTVNGSQYVTHAADSALDFAGTSPFTLEVWVNPAKIDTVFRRILKNEPSIINGYFFYHQSTRGFHFERDIGQSGGGGSGRDLASGVFPVVGQWYHLVGTYDGTDMRVYVNGLLTGGPLGSSGSMIALNSTFDAGRESLPGNGDWFQGTLDEVAVYGTALSAARIAIHYNLAWTAKPGGRVLPVVRGGRVL